MDDRAKGTAGEVPSDWPVRYPLKTPIENDQGEMISELVLQEPTVKRLRTLDKAKGQVESAALLIGACAGCSSATIDRLSGADFIGIGALLADFLGQASSSDF